MRIRRDRGFSMNSTTPEPEKTHRGSFRRILEPRREALERSW